MGLPAIAAATANPSGGKAYLAIGFTLLPQAIPHS